LFSSVLPSQKWHLLGPNLLVEPSPDLFLMDTRAESILSRLTTDEDLKIARDILDEENHLRVMLAYLAGQEAGIKIKPKRAAKILGVNEKTVRRWLDALKGGEPLLCFALSLGLLLFELFDYWQ